MADVLSIVAPGPTSHPVTATAPQQHDVGIDSVIPVPPDGYASPIHWGDDGSSVPVGDAGRYPPPLSLTDALAESPNTAFVKLEGVDRDPAGGHGGRSGRGR